MKSSRCVHFAAMGFLSMLLVEYVYSVTRDYYDILGVKKTATDREIKRAFRKLAIQYHPDKNKDPDAEKTFVEIGKAYEVLSDKEKRRQYDMMGPGAFEEQGRRSQGDPGGAHFNFNFHEFFQGFDDSFQQHRQHRNGGRHHQKVNFGGGFFDFGSLWDDFDDDILGDFGGFGSSAFANGHFQATRHHHQHQHQHQQHYQHHQTRTTVHRSNSGGQRCRTVTQKVGNMITTHTQCS